MNDHIFSDTRHCPADQVTRSTVLRVALWAARDHIMTMAKTQQTFGNNKDGPIYISVEPWPQCFELEPGDKLTLIWDAPVRGDTVNINFVNDRELVVWPSGEIDDIQFLLNEEPGEERSWVFKHQ